MEEQLIMGNILTLVKNLCVILNHAVIESPNNNETLNKVLDDYLELQHEIYMYMVNQGWYQIENVTPDKITKAKEKYAMQN